MGKIKMKLKELILDLENLDPELTIYIDGAWGPESNILLCFEPEDGSSPKEYEYFLEVFILQELFESTPDITVERIIQYALYDA